ncbi:endo-1,4-beta-xylanase [Paenibacillus sp.]|uniref:endo-1,4-beta-xylanase n=1 Tax=Paenibacillus sp. TaxID=58172 RepID=UPI002D50B4EF|nr:endo-1,4-beta-xylanase [Paenibacillus sp.]HZG83435.1 endo-1,4-beta-xylanase [Paenibacillus sp.]
MRKWLKNVGLMLLAALLLTPQGVPPAAKASAPDIPVLLYHRIVTNATDEWTHTSLEQFKNQLKYLSDHGYDTLSAEQYVNILEGKEAAPDKPILLTFDDATPDYVTTALPLLKQYGMKSVQFVVSDWIGGGYSMSEAQLRSLASEPSVSLQNHSKTHGSAVWTNAITAAQAQEEISAANAYLKEITGKDPILLAYPYGAFNANAQAAAEANGLRYAFKVGYPNQGDYAMGRHYIRKDTTLSQFAAMVGGPEPTDSTDTVTVYHESFAGGQGAAVPSGGATLTQAAGKPFDGNADGAALYVGNRVNNWDAADFRFGDIGLEHGRTYTITVTGYVDEGAEVPAGAQAYLQTVNSYAWLAGANFEAGKPFVLSKEFTVDTSKDAAIRVQSNNEGASVPFYIGDIHITAKKTTVTEKEVYRETFAGGQGAAVPSGGATLTQVAGKPFEGNADGAALYVGNRVNNWDAADFRFGDIGLVNGKTYTVTVTGYVDEGTSVPAGAQAYLQTVNSYAWLAGANFEAGKPFVLSKEFTVDTSKDAAIRVQSNNEGASVPFYIGDVRITEKAESDPNEPPRPPALPFSTITFEDQTTGGFEGRAGTETLTVTNEANRTEGGSYSLKVEGRTQSWHGPSLRVEKYVDQGYEYTISVWAKLISPASSQIQLSTQIGQGSSASYNNILGQTITTADGWVLYEGKYRYNNVGDEYLTIYVESSNNATASFYIDDISFVRGAGPIAIQKDLLPIKTAYEDDFLIGNAVSAADMEGVRFELLEMHHNVITAENAMKPDAMQPTKGSFTFDGADAIVEKALAEGFKVHGHVLVWHQQTPAWMNTSNGAPLGREEALQNLRNHIKTVMEHYGEKVMSWDVVNEAIIDNPPNPSNWEAALRQSAWYQSIGPDYVEQAFLAAREVLDARGWDIKLYYNDYNDDNQNKAQAIYSMVKAINDKYALTHPGKKLIDGIGMQGHYNLSTNPENVKLSLEKFASLGVEISVTELDIQAGTNGVQTEQQRIAQGYLYAQLFDLYRTYADDIVRVTFWGLNDASSWRATASPLVFDKDLQAKPAYYGVIDPDKFMEEHPPTLPEANQSTARYATPIVDGTVDAVWNDAQAMSVNRYQMAWQGASGVAKALWDDQNLYVLIQVSDAQLDKSSPNPWEQDSIEVFLDQNNAKSSFYQADDGQYRVNFDNETSFNPAGAAEGFASATNVSGTNYTVEVKIPLKHVVPANDKKLGFDVQINDGNNGARQSAAAWNDTTGSGYMDTSVFGVLTLVGKDDVPPTATVSYSEEGPTNGDVVAVLVPSEPVTITNNGGSLSYTFTENGSFTFEFVDAAGNAGTATATVANIDKTAPALTVVANPAVLPVPNHKLVPVRLTWTAFDEASGIASVKLLSVASNEPDDGLGDGDTPNDIQDADIGEADDAIRLRAERSGTGDGRVYTIVYEATDLAGNKTTAAAYVRVPLNARPEAN